jgi:hypothetical protein
MISRPRKLKFPRAGWLYSLHIFVFFLLFEMRVYICSKLSKRYHTRSQIHACTAGGIPFIVLTSFEVSSPIDDPTTTLLYASPSAPPSNSQVTDNYAPVDTAMTDYSASPSSSPAAPSSSDSSTSTTSSTTTFTETIKVSSLSSSISTPMVTASTVTVDASGKHCEL